MHGNNSSKTFWNRILFFNESIQNKVNVWQFMIYDFFLMYPFKKAWKLFKNKSHPLLRLSSSIQYTKIWKIALFSIFSKPMISFMDDPLRKLQSWLWKVTFSSPNFFIPDTIQGHLQSGILKNLIMNPKVVIVVVVYKIFSKYNKRKKKRFLDVLNFTFQMTL